LYFLSAEDGYTEEKRQRYEDAIKVLRSIAKGEVSLGIETEQSEDASPVAMEVEMSSETRIFNRNNNNRIF
jgi:phage gp36-like protein